MPPPTAPLLFGVDRGVVEVGATVGVGATGVALLALGAVFFCKRPGHRSAKPKSGKKAKKAAKPPKAAKVKPKKNTGKYGRVANNDVGVDEWGTDTCACHEDIRV